MCTYGFATRAVLQASRDYDPLRLRSIGARVSAPVLPGDALRTKVWRDGDVVSFRTTAPDRGGLVVLDNGRATVSPAS